MIKLIKRLLDFSGKERGSLLLSFVFTLLDSVFQMLPILAILTVLAGLLAAGCCRWRRHAGANHLDIAGCYGSQYPGADRVQQFVRWQAHSGQLFHVR